MMAWNFIGQIRASIDIVLIKAETDLAKIIFY